MKYDLMAMAARWLRFALAGLGNTAVTYGVYLALNLVINYSTAYFIAYFTGVFLSYYLNVVYVFKKKITAKGFFSYPVVYIAQYVISALLLLLVIDVAHVPESAGPLVVIAAMLPVTYLANKLIIDATQR